MKLFKRVTIIGLGLIGGSLGLAIKKAGLAKEVIGVSRRMSTIRGAKAIRAVDSATLDIKKSVEGSDLVILTAPVLTIINIAKKIAGCLKKGAIVIDAGSTKKTIVSKIEAAFPKTVYFVGSHPIAGSERSGVTSADKDLFKGAYCILTKSARTHAESIARIKKFWEALGMKVEIMSPDDHDETVSRLSHLPHAIAVALSNTCAKCDLRMAAGGFKDTTRISSGAPELWKDIFTTNRKNIIKDIVKYKKELSKIEKALRNNKDAELLRLLRKAKSIRDSI
ncbi:MAG: prephenate dehydrogenase [Candidatus Omnitrophica bacterium]|nr:prephenate dehydrogenase [Candidatus Omnitrophota bacterium]